MNSREIRFLEKANGALVNVLANSEIASLMSEFTYNAEKIMEGEALLAETQAAWKSNKQEGDEMSAAYSVYNGKMEELETRYSLDRRKAKTVFRKDDEVMKQLLLKGRIPGAYDKFMTVCSTLYSEAGENADLLAKLARMKITAETMAEGAAHVEEVRDARNTYQNERSESEQATLVKDAAMAKLDDWMDDFYAVAKIALDDQPQYLEALGIRVRS